jgi:8-oxo-dGTP pyrophosphatase MutT (NUDIX family)
VKPLQVKDTAVFSLKIYKQADREIIKKKVFMIYDHSYGVLPVKKEQTEWKVFLIKHKKGEHWGFPKGHAENQETAQMAAIRETKEECGLNFKRFLFDIPLEETYVFTREKEKISKTVLYFIAEVEGEPKLQPEEIADGRWFSLIDARKQLTFPATKVLCDRVTKILFSL